MKLVNSTGNVWRGRAQSVLRIVSAFLFMSHGMQKILSFPVAPAAPIQWLSMSGIAGLLELVGGLLLLLGLFTRPVAFILCGEMAVAYFMAHAPRGFWPLLNRGELAALYSFVFLYLAAAGGGPWSLDACWNGRRLGDHRRRDRTLGAHAVSLTRS